MKTQTVRKVTVLLPADLVKRAMRATGAGLTPTIRKGLETVAAAAAYERLLASRGKFRLSLDVDQMREDRD
jgi:hypothetical protein